MIIWLTGNSGAGKSTLAQKMKEQMFDGRDVEILDGDEIRQRYRLISDGKHAGDIPDNALHKDVAKHMDGPIGYHKEARWWHCLQTAELAKGLDEGGLKVVIVAVIAPYRELREEIRKICNPLFIYLLERGHKPSDEYPYELPEDTMDFNIHV